MKKLIRNTISISVVLIISYFLLYNLYNNLDKIKEYNMEFNYFLLFISFMLLIFYLFVASINWYIILRKIHYGKLRILKLIKILILSQLFKYVPGKIFTAIGRLYLCKKEGIKYSKAFISILLELIMTVLAGFFIFIIITGNLIKSFSYFYFLLLIPLFVIVLRPNIIIYFINYILKFRNKKMIPNLKIGVKFMLLLFILYSISWLIYGLSLYIFIKSIITIPIPNFFIISGVFAISWIIGFLVFFVPGGLGIREGTLAYLLSFYLPLPLSILVAILYRILNILTEIIGSIVLLRFK